ncbi:selenocysteine-specific translation elongation factor [Geobacter sulfurreducens]|jgi:selenocysteine-specific elongation factor|uniref:Selenocysteine-specific elongation factor n=1 Tax=Geobacter sulfurreducens (strain ATCC 51573 / DSM 12127 / PCA) TaxID=243231 RepID=Q74GZ1_GEOSL|nr:selenocysteine-specific translation elongation factor [Geobacter sulfurreducens]AAR33437.1 selenocysteine-specific translation elongation factor [Geobacter sulfurreducens PCA]ADI82940.1 selenocysteine-specific translation elongation factor [Geobacter sulfurreducens KN400]AJY69841.1 translation elongation factor [Geobacter sulfurreducens]QVW35381.1 selenocysteine-specific translation elongation factor [Geobacter sulfurreducens]UAC04205.1 selenocysteine-specific translation elongation factor 
MKHLILGTAGHIDHGKTSLVRALTGIDTDRLPEEKARGITIELGFAHLELPGGLQFGIVDVPGHERFVRTMVAGVGGMDLVMLVIAADEGVMPQTREHLEICQLLGVKKGLVALTKSDMVDPDWLELVVEEVRDYLAGSFLEEAPIVPVSSRTGAGIEAVKAELARLAGQVDEKKTEGPFRLPVDRVFTVTGFGTVVTGTLLSGAISVGDEVELLPSGLSARVRGVQTHGRRGDAASAGQRVAVNLQGVEHTEVGRGDIVVPRGVYRTTRAVDARLDYLPSAPRELRHRSTLRLHSATYEVPAQVILLDRDVLAPGDSTFVQLRLRHPVLLLPGDPFVLRSYSPQATLGGGKVLDPMPPRRRRRSDEALALLEALGERSESDTVRLLVSGSLLTGICFEDIVVRGGLSARRAEATMATLLSSGEVVQMVREPRIFLSRASFVSLKGGLLSEVEGYLRDNPLREGLGKEELKTRLPRRSDPRFFTPLLTSLEKEGKIVVDRDLVKLPGRKGTITVDQADLQVRLEKALQRGGYEPPTIKEMCDSLRCAEKMLLEHLNILAREERAVKVKSDIFYAPEPVADIREKLMAYLREKGEIMPPEFRELTGLSRKFMIPLLEFFDQEKITIRVGDKRVLRRG